jgi:Zn-dependent peptidase ImmA (M78 family)
MTLPGVRTKVIIRNPAHSPERSASDVMHELAHVLLEHEPGNVFFGPNGMALRTHNKDQEDEARWLSGCLLLPRESLFAIRRRRLSDLDACREYGVSQDMLTFRRQTSGVDKQFFGRRR